MVRHDKRSVVKHRTRGSEPHKKGGFHVGATNVPNGAYIGRAKKHKEALIHKAKVKKAYYKMLDREKGAAPVEATDPARRPERLAAAEGPNSPSVSRSSSSAAASSSS